ncbi:MAG TPA: CHAD domain-containing protein [Anaerolineales bacterium]|nr:CHAD domain-containing protein [Anaerolineales bacterium]
MRINKSVQTMDAKDLILDSLDERSATYVKKAKRCRDDFSSDAVHDLRTSIRRLLAILEVVAFMTSGSKIEKLSDRLEDQLDGFSDLRDMHVMLDQLEKDVTTLPELEPFQNYLEKREKRRQRQDQKHVQNIKPGGIEKRLLKIRRDVEALAEVDVRRELPQAVDQAYLTVIQRYGEVDPVQLVTIHELRVAFKNFRYMVEAIHPCLPNFPETLLKRMQEYQTEMGNVHDIQVFLETLAEFAEKSESYNVVPVRRIYERNLAEVVSDFLKHKHEVLTFWRATPLEAFPWEAGQTKKEE